MESVTLKPVAVVVCGDPINSPLYQFDLVDGVCKLRITPSKLFNGSEFLRSIQFTQDTLEVEEGAFIENRAALSAATAQAANDAISEYDFDDSDEEYYFVHFSFIKAN